ncbi:MAG: hypothetical protein LH606_15155 [Cytophagaceae bacterium]|nr:hypothetical protein [Cytophagaceae bacterium]
MKNWLLFLGIIISLGCQKAPQGDMDPVQNTGLVGKWKLVEYLEAGGSGGWQKMDETSAPKIVEFKADGSFTGSASFPFIEADKLKSYRILDDKRLEMGVKNSFVSFFGVPALSWQYADLTPTTLRLTFPCPGGCGGKYVAVE